jgi:ATP-dependent exoDNAse (exonuclease V) beta subunit
MTVHKSKGLEFDLVFYPLLKDERMDKRDGSEIFCADERNLGEGTRPWVMAIPGEDFCAADPVLQASGEALRERSTFDNLCNLYVAMTRARRALVVLTPE